MTLTINDITTGPDDPPKVELLLTGLDPDVATVTAYRLSGGFELPVAGVIRAAVAGAGSWVDFEVPAVQTTYRVEFFDGDDASLGFSESVTLTVAYTGCWMHNPLSPRGAVRVQLIDTAGRALSRPVPGGIVYPKGRRVGVMVSQPRRGLAGAVFDVHSPDLASADRVQAFLGGQQYSTVPVICIRMGVDYERFRVQSPLFLGVLDIVEEDIDVRWGGTDTVQRISGDEVARPAPGLFIPLLRRMDLNAYYASRAELNSENLTRLAANRRYDLAGFAGG